MKYYDLIVSLGDACFVEDALFRCQLTSRKKRMPLDLCRGVLWNKCGHGGLSGKVDLICRDFKDFFKLEDLEIKGPDVGNPKMLWVINKANGMSFRHDFRVGVPIENDYPEVKAKYDEYIHRFYDEITHSDKVLFVYMAQMEGFDNNYLLEQQVRLQHKFPHQTIDLLYIIHDGTYSPTEYKELPLSDHVLRIDANMKYSAKTDMMSVLAGNRELYEGILKRYCTPISFNTESTRTLHYIQCDIASLSRSAHKRLSRLENFMHHNQDEKQEPVRQQRLFLYMVANNPIYFRFKMLHMLLKKWTHFGERRTRYSEQYQRLKCILREAKAYSRLMFKTYLHRSL
ncbi:MAG: hypothetical protein J1E42_02590 [Akkermansiaceae bacterium]|nr:hypothetical protein [Akkermansiaceae bacterium]